MRSKDSTYASMTETLTVLLDFGALSGGGVLAGTRVLSAMIDLHQFGLIQCAESTISRFKT